MATSSEYIDFICDSIRRCGEVRSRKMFGDYIVYIDDKPILTVCDNTVFVKILPVTDEIMIGKEKGYPYDGAKEHYILDVEDKELTQKVVLALKEIIPVPKKRNKNKV